MRKLFYSSEKGSVYFEATTQISPIYHPVRPHSHKQDHVIWQNLRQTIRPRKARSKDENEDKLTD